MKFKYLKFPLRTKSNFFGTSILKPIIPIELINEQKKIRYAALIDSGADFCIFNGEIGELLGFDVRSGKREGFSGIQQAGIAEVFIHKVILVVGGWDYEAAIGFSYDISKSGYGILGQKGFFDRFELKFNLLKEEIELRHILN